MKQKSLRYRRSLPHLLNGAFILAVVVIMVYPIWYCHVGSFNQGQDFDRGGVLFWVRAFTTTNYRALFLNTTIREAFLVTIARSILGTVTSLLFTAMVSFGMLYGRLQFKKSYLSYMVFTLFFSGGLIPYFLLIYNIGLYDSFLVYIVPSLFSMWKMIIIQAYMREIPDSYLRAARIDGASEYRIFFELILPLSKPVLAAVALFTFVWHWNAYFDSMLFTNSAHLQTLQLFIKKVVTDTSVFAGLNTQALLSIPEEAYLISPRTIKLVAMVVTSLPIVCIYPFF